nr:response regulator [Desulfobacula sp.]
MVFNLNQSVEAILTMIRRLIGENIDLAWLPGTGPFMVRMDPSQLDQIMVNLCVNARDAIAGVGRVTIETDAVSFDETYCRLHTETTPGEYARLSVGDNGCGMDEETLAHIFEPFFTTKGLGQGTGMGLATIYGIVRQNKGFITVYSEKETGSVFKVHIPMNTTGAEGTKTEKSETVPSGKGESILIVEDDPMMLEMTAMMLQSLGYSVLSAATPGEAVDLVRGNPTKIHLFITDVVMPEMNGRELAERILEIRPTIKHLFMSGYTANVIAHQGVLDEGINFIQKPFILKDLAVKIREILG